MTVVYLGLGANIGDKAGNIHHAIDKINERIGEVFSLSAFYITDPVDFISQNSFLNAACGVITNLLPIEVLNKTEEIEREIGRTKKSIAGQHFDRMIDIDILLYDDLILDSDRLKIPHPRMTEREFVLEPLAEIAPDVIEPISGCSVLGLLERLRTNTDIYYI